MSVIPGTEQWRGGALFDLGTGEGFEIDRQWRVPCSSGLTIPGASTLTVVPVSQSRSDAPCLPTDPFLFEQQTGVPSWSQY